MKTNRFLLAVACATMAFTLFACSDDKDDPPTPTGKACVSNTSPVPGATICMDLGKTITQAECDGGSKDDMKLTLQEESCPSGYELDCDKKGIKIYFYGEAASSITCEVLNN